jgi:hypothetical protein
MRRLRAAHSFWRVGLKTINIDENTPNTQKGIKFNLIPH